jgi:hypothetical protein
VPDDATNQVVYAQLWESESTRAVMTALWDVFTTCGLPMALYSDRAHWAFHTPKAKGPVDKTHRTQVGRALEQLGVEHSAYSRSAGAVSGNRTFQDRLSTSSAWRAFAPSRPRTPTCAIAPATPLRASGIPA